MMAVAEMAAMVAISRIDSTAAMRGYSRFVKWGVTKYPKPIERKLDPDAMASWEVSGDGLTWTYGFDQRNQLVWVEECEDDEDLLQRVEFRYDAFGSRIEKKVDEDGNATWDTTQRYALDGWKNVRQPLVGNENWDVWADLDGSSSLTTRYVRGDAIDQLFSL